MRDAVPARRVPIILWESFQSEGRVCPPLWLRHKIFGLHPDRFSLLHSVDTTSMATRMWYSTPTSSCKFDRWCWLDLLSSTFEDYPSCTTRLQLQMQPNLSRSYGFRKRRHRNSRRPDPKGTYKECIAQFDKNFGQKSSTLLRRKTFFQKGRDLAKLKLFLPYVCAVYLLNAPLVPSGISSALVRSCLPKKLKFNSAIKKAEAFETRPYCSNTQNSHQTSQKQLATSTPKKLSTSKKCFRCDSLAHVTSAPDCPARNYSCRSC